ncbi:MAG: hypothetical protein ACRC3Z_06090 [Phocaeicola sp.]
MERNVINGQFLPGNTLGKGRVKGSRNKLTQALLDRVAARQEDNLSLEDVVMDIAYDPNQPAELRLKAAAKILDIVHPKSASVEVTLDDETGISPAEMEARIEQLLGLAKPVEKEDY